MITAEEAKVLTAYHKAREHERYITEFKEGLEDRITKAVHSGVNYIFLQYKLKTPEILSWLESLGYRLEYQREDTIVESTTINW